MEDENKKQWYQPMEPDSDREETLDLFEEAGLYELKDNGELFREYADRARQPEQRKKRRWGILLWILAGAAVVALIIGTAVYFSREQEPAAELDPSEYYQFFEEYGKSQTITGENDIPRADPDPSVQLTLETSADLEALELQTLYDRCVVSVVGVMGQVSGRDYSWGTGIIMTADGYTGYIQTEDISEPEAIEARTAKKDSYERITRDHKINLVWHQSTSTESNDAMAEMTAEMTGVNVISPTWFSVTDETGTISSLASADYVKLAHDAGREVWGLIDNFNEAFDETTDLAYASVRSRIIEQLLAEAASCGMDGINVDFENLKEAGIPHYLQFLRELTSAAHAQNLVVSVDTPVPQAYTMYYQRGEQARFVDYMIVMAYDEHFAGSEEAGSVSSLPFVQQAVEEMTRVMPADQVICGIPFYTRVWTEKFGQSAITSEVLGMDGAKNYAKENQMTETWDASLGQNVATVETSDARYTIWMEDEQSMEEKLKVIQSADLAGVAEWKLGFECADVWSLISEYIETNS